MQNLVPMETIAQILSPVKLVLSKPQFGQVERIVSGLLLAEGRRTLEAIRRVLVEQVSKGSLNHFLAESPWSEEEVHDQVLEVVSQYPLVAPRADGILFADDTLTGEHYGEQIEGLAKYRDVTAPGIAYIYSHCLVNLHYEHELTRRERRQSGHKEGHVEYWLDYRLYRRQAELAAHGLAQQFRTKPQLLVEMLTAQDWQRLAVRTIAFDHQYLTPEVVQTCTDLGLDWVSKAGKNDYACWQGEWLRLDEILTRLPAHKCKAVWVQTKNGRRRYWVSKQRLRLRTLYNGEIELTVVFSKSRRDATKAAYLVTNANWSARQVLRIYARRWTIETGHKHQKHLLGVADYQMVRLKTIQRFWLLNLLAYAVLACIRFTPHPLAQELVPAVRTLGQARNYLAVLACLAFVSLIVQLAQHYEPQDIVRHLYRGLPSDELRRFVSGIP